MVWAQPLNSLWKKTPGDEEFPIARSPGLRGEVFDLFFSKKLWLPCEDHG